MRASTKLTFLQLEDRLVPALPIGSLDSIPADFTVRGWAFDPDTGSQSMQVHLYVDGQFAGAATTDQLRQDVNNTYGISGNHGYGVVIPARFIDGNQHTATVYAIDTWGGPNAAIGSRVFRDQPTRGSWDGITNDGYIFGWAFDPDNGAAV